MLSFSKKKFDHVGSLEAAFEAFGVSIQLISGQRNSQEEEVQISRVLWCFF